MIILPIKKQIGILAYCLHEFVLCMLFCDGISFLSINELLRACFI